MGAVVYFCSSRTCYIKKNQKVSIGCKNVLPQNLLMTYKLFGPKSFQNPKIFLEAKLFLDPNSIGVGHFQGPMLFLEFESYWTQYFLRSKIYQNLFSHSYLRVLLDSICFQDSKICSCFGITFFNQNRFLNMKLSQPLSEHFISSKKIQHSCTFR